MVPEQTSPEQSREEFGEEVTGQLNDMLVHLKRREINVEKELAYTPDYAESVNRIIRQNNCNAVLTAQPIDSVERLLVPIYARDQINARLATVLHDLALSSNLPVSLVFLTSGEDESEDVESVEEMEQLAMTHLRRVGLSEDQIRTDRADVSDVAAAVDQLVAGDDLVILAESSTTDRNSFFNTLHEDIEEAISCPVLVVLRETAES